MKKLTLIILLVVSLSHRGGAQEDAQYSQYLYNHFFFNCAVAGADGHNWITSHTRMYLSSGTAQPFSTYLGYQSALSNESVGMGFIGIYDRDLSMNVRSIKFGLSGNYEHEIAEGSSIRVGAQLNVSKFNEETNSGEQFTSYVPEIDFGVWYTVEKLFLGLSTKNMAQSRLNLSSDQLASTSRTVYLLAGYEFEFSEKLAITPNILMRKIGLRTPVFDLNTSFEFLEKGIFAATLRVSRFQLNYPFTMMGGLKLADNFRLMFSVDIPRFNSGDFLNNIYEGVIQFRI